MVSRPAIAVIIFLAGLILIGCSGNPTTPSGQQSSVPDIREAADVISHHCLAYYMLAVDTRTFEVEAIPLRSGEWHFNMVGMLNNTMGVSAAVVPGESDPVNGLFVLDISLEHPLPTAPQFAGFDVKGILMTPGTLALGPLTFAGVGETHLENADGYSRWWNPTEFTTPGIFGYTQGALTKASESVLTATVNPYKYFADILGPTDGLAFVTDEPLTNDQGRGVFTAGSTNTRRYAIRFPVDPAPQIIFGYAVDCSWNAPSPNPPTEIPDNFPINANQPEAYRIFLAPTANSLYYDSETGIGGGVLRLQINVHDWQGHESGDQAAEFNAVRVFAPGLMTGGVDATFLNQTTAKARYTVDLTGIAVPTAAGPTPIIVRVGSADGSTYKQGAAPAPDEPLSAFHMIMPEIPDPVCAGDANNDWLEAVPIGFDEPIVDQVCLPDDYRDFYTLELPPGYEPTGEIRLNCDATNTKLGIYDHTQTLIDEADIVTGVATLSFDTLNLTPGSYYIRVLTSNASQIGYYLLELTGVLQNITPANPVDVTPSDIFCDPSYIWLHDDYAFMSSYLGVWVYDISTPSNPVQVSYSRLYSTDDVDFHYPYLYYLQRPATGEGQVNMIDFSDPSSPVEHLDIIHYGFELEDLCMNSTHLYVGSYVQPTSEVYIYDYASDPTAPAQVGVFNVSWTPQVMTLMDAEGPNTRLVIGTWDEIETYLVENPASVTPTGTFTFPVGETVRDLTTDGDYIYAAYDKSLGGDGWLEVYYQSSIPSVTNVGHLDIAGSGSYIDIKWPYVYIGDGSAGVTICDVTTPTAPGHVSTTQLISSAADLAIDSDDMLYAIPEDAGMQVIDVSTPVSPALVERLHVVNHVYDLVRKDEYLFAAELGNGGYSAIKSVDISNPEAPRVADEIFLSKRPWKLFIEGDILAVGYQNDWELYDAADPENISIYCTRSEMDNIKAVGIYGNALYIATNSASSDSIRIYDITDPMTPIYKWTLNLPDTIGDIQFVSGFMYVVTYTSIETHSLTNPFLPNNVDSYSYSTLGYFSGAVQGNYLYLTAQDNLEIADISTPSAPSFAGSVLFPVVDFNFYYNIAVDGQLGFMSGYTAKAHSALLFPPDNPTLIGPVYEGFLISSRALIAHDGYLYDGTEPYGIQIYDLY
jgi:hypothetical protein